MNAGMTMNSLSEHKMIKVLKVNEWECSWREELKCGNKSPKTITWLMLLHRKINY